MDAVEGFAYKRPPLANRHTFFLFCRKSNSRAPVDAADLGIHADGMKLHTASF
jgi:hypothetical protein